MDHFSPVADSYVQFRPHYPTLLFDWLRSVVPAHDLVWDCGCGSGQATIGLIDVFDHVIATDMSAAQLVHAPPLPNVVWKMAPAEDCGLPDHLVDAVVIAQALHWFDLPRFWDEVRRVLRPGGVVTAWCYQSMTVDDPASNALLLHYHDVVVGMWWPANRRHVDNGYADLSFPFPRLAPPRNVTMITADWDVDHVLGYLRSWSATRHAQDATGEDPVLQVEADLRRAWGTGERRVSWPLTVMAGRT